MGAFFATLLPCPSMNPVQIGLIGLCSCASSLFAATADELAKEIAKRDAEVLKAKGGSTTAR